MACTLAAAQTTSRLIVKLRDAGAQHAGGDDGASARFTADAAAAGVALTPVRAMALGAHVMALDRPLPREAAAIAARLAQNPDVEYVQPDFRRHCIPHAQRHACRGAVATSAIRQAESRRRRVGRDHGIAQRRRGGRRHRLSSARRSRGQDPARLRLHHRSENRQRRQRPRRRRARIPATGSMPTDQSIPNFRAGLHGRGQLVARHVRWPASSPRIRTTAQWLAGIDWAAKILPVRVLGKCGGYDSDIIDGIAWAAGLAVPGRAGRIRIRRRSST